MVLLNSAQQVTGSCYLVESRRCKGFTKMRHASGPPREENEGNCPFDCMLPMPWWRPCAH
jgi:hypothetical protein